MAVLFLIFLRNFPADFRSGYLQFTGLTVLYICNMMNQACPEIVISHTLLKKNLEIKS